MAGAGVAAGILSAAGVAAGVVAGAGVVSVVAVLNYLYEFSDILGERWNQMFYLAVSVEVSAFGSSAGFGASAGFGFGFTIIRTIKPFSVKL